MGKPKPPPTPDYNALAQSQGAENRRTTQEEWLRNNSPQTTPYGSRNIVADPSSPSGFRIEETLNEADQGRLDQQRAIQAQLLGVAPSMITQLQGAIGKSVDLSDLPGLVGGVDISGMQGLNFNLPKGQYGFERGKITGDLSESGEATRRRVEDAAYGKWAARALPEHDRQTNALNTRVANMGGSTSAPAARRMARDLQTTQNDALRDAEFDAILRGGTEAERDFGMGLQRAQFQNAAQQQDYAQLGGLADLWNQSRMADANLQQTQAGFNNNVVGANIQNRFNNANLSNAARNQGVSERVNMQNLPINQIMAVLNGGQVNPLQFQQAIASQQQAAPLFQAGQLQYQADLGRWNAQQAQSAAPWQMIGSLAGAALGGPMGASIGGALFGGGKKA